MFVTFAETILGYMAMGGLCVLALWLSHFSFHLTLGFGLVWTVLPIVLWWFCDRIALAMSHSVAADPNNPEQKRVMDLIDKVWRQSGLRFKPRIFASPDESPNAFATGPIHRKAVVAFTAGLLKIGATDEEIMAVFAHELGHVRNYDVAINSFLSVLSSIFFLIVEGWFKAWGWVKKLFGVHPQARVLPPIVGNVLMYAVYWLCSQVTKIIQMFVVRSRESGADATGAYITGNPCALSMALQKLVAYMETHRPQKGTREHAMIQVFRPIMTIDPLFDSMTPAAKPTGVWGRIKAIWRYLQLTHPPVPERCAQLDKMAGYTCPRLPKVKVA
jgi:heat shock protein HtpX